MQFEPEPEDEWQAHCRNAVAMAEGETAPEEPVMAGEVVRVEAEAESELVVAGEVVPEIVEGAEGVATEPVIASEESSDDDSSYVPDDNSDYETSDSDSKERITRIIDPPDGMDG